LDGIVIVRPEPSREHPQHLCLDAGYDYPLMRLLVRARGYREHIRSRGEEKTAKAIIPGYRARRWAARAHALLAPPIPPFARQLSKRKPAIISLFSI
jgi:putative transposase